MVPLSVGCWWGLDKGWFRLVCQSQAGLGVSRVGDALGPLDAGLGARKGGGQRTWDWDR